MFNVLLIRLYENSVAQTDLWNERSWLGLGDRLPYHLLLNLLNALEVLQPHHLRLQIL